MDFAKLMSGAISASSTSKPAASSPATKSKYLKRSEVEAQREAAYRAEQAAEKQTATDKAAAKRKREDDDADRAAQREIKRRQLAEASHAKREEEARIEEAARRERLGLPPLPDPTDATDAAGDVPAQEDIEEDELLAKLRTLQEPARLFGEAHAARLKRYRALTAPKIVFSQTIIPTTLVLPEEKDMQIPAATPPAGTPERAFLFRQLASYFTLVLTEWVRELALRPTEVRESTTGRQAELAMQASRDNLRPLFRLFETGEMPPPMLDAVGAIVRAAQARRYVDANNEYLQLSIGKAAWPIGVVSVGIHERASRSRIGEERGNVAHIMGDETVRRWLQAIKRCITFAQTRWPPDDHMQLMG